MSSQKTLYLNVSQITEVRNKDVFLKDIAKIYCDDRNIENRVNAMKVKAIRLDKNRRYMENVLDIIQDIQKQFPDLQINNIGEVDYIIDYHVPHKPRRTWEWIKTIFVCLICFFGAALDVYKRQTDNMDKYELGIALQKVYDFIWEEFCDWYIEMVKPRL